MASRLGRLFLCAGSSFGAALFYWGCPLPTTLSDRLTGVSSSVAVKAPVRLATTAAITLSGLQTIDGELVDEGDRILVKDQADAVANGIYVASARQWLRAPDFDGVYDAVGGTQLYVIEGSANNSTYWRTDGLGPLVITDDEIVFEAITGPTTLASDLASSANNKGGGLVGWSPSASYPEDTVGWALQYRVNAAFYGFDEANTGAQNKTALDAVVASGAKYIRIPPGNHTVATTTLNGLQGVGLYGDGDAFGTQLKTDSGAVFRLVGSTNIVFRDLTIHGSAAVTGTKGVSADHLSSFKIYNCYFYFLHGPAIESVGTISDQVSQCIIADTAFFSNAWDGTSGQIEFTYSNDFTFRNLEVGAFRPVTNRPGYGLKMTNASNGRLDDVKVWQNTYGALFTSCLYNRVVGCRFEESLQYGLKLASCSLFTGSANWVNDNSLTLTNTYDSIILDATTDCTFTGTIFYNWGQPSRLARYNLVLQNASLRNSFIGSKSLYFGTGHYSRSADSGGNHFDQNESYTAISTVASGATVYLASAGPSSSVSTGDKSSGPACAVALTLQLSAAPSSGQNVVGTLMVNGVASALTVTVADGNFSATGVGSIALSAGDVTSIRLVYSGSAVASIPVALLEKMAC